MELKNMPASAVPGFSRTHPLMMTPLSREQQVSGWVHNDWATSLSINASNCRVWVDVINMVLGWLMFW